MIGPVQWRRVAVSLCMAGAVACAFPLRAQEASGTLTSDRFELRQMRGVPEEDARRVLDYLTASYSEIQGQVGLEPKQRLEVRIYDGVGRFLSETGLRKPWRGAYYSRGVIHCQPVAALAARHIFETALRYELARAMLEKAGERGCPLWLREAYAVYYAGEYKGFTPPLGAKLSSFSDLNQDIQTYQDPPQRNDVHYMLGRTMVFFIEKYGERKAMGMFKQFDGTRGLEATMKRALGDDLGTIEKSWAKYISYYTTPFKRK